LPRAARSRPTTRQRILIQRTRSSGISDEDGYPCDTEFSGATKLQRVCGVGGTLTYRNFSNSLPRERVLAVKFDALAPGCEQFLYLRGKPRIVGLDGALECGYRLPRPIEQVLMKVPTRRFAGLGGELTE